MRRFGWLDGVVGVLALKVRTTVSLYLTSDDIQHVAITCFKTLTRAGLYVFVQTTGRSVASA